MLAEIADTWPCEDAEVEWLAMAGVLVDIQRPTKADKLIVVHNAAIGVAIDSDRPVQLLNRNIAFVDPAQRVQIEDMAHMRVRWIKSPRPCRAMQSSAAQFFRAASSAGILQPVECLAHLCLHLL